MALIVPSEKSLGQVDGAAEKYIHPYLCESRKHSKNLNRIIINSTTRHEGIYKLFLTFFTCLKLALTRSFTTLASNACRGSSSISLLILAAFCKYFFAQLIVFATPIGAFPEIFQIFIQIIIICIQSRKSWILTTEKEENFVVSVTQHYIVTIQIPVVIFRYWAFRYHTAVAGIDIWIFYGRSKREQVLRIWKNWN